MTEKPVEELCKGDVIESEDGTFHMTVAGDPFVVGGTEVHFPVRFKGMGRGGPMLATRRIGETVVQVPKATKHYQREVRP